MNPLSNFLEESSDVLFRLFFLIVLAMAVIRILAAELKGLSSVFSKFVEYFGNVDLKEPKDESQKKA